MSAEQRVKRLQDQLDSINILKENIERMIADANYEICMSKLAAMFSGFKTKYPDFQTLRPNVAFIFGSDLSGSPNSAIVSLIDTSITGVVSMRVPSKSNMILFMAIGDIDFEKCATTKCSPKFQSERRL